jgi:hypothetical protein
MGEILAKMIASVLAFAVAGIPTWIYLLARSAFDPQGFWQNLVLAGFGLYFLGTIQILFALVFIGFFFWVWFEA